MSRAWCLALALSGCITPRTEIILGVATDLSARDQIDTVQLKATRDGIPVLDQTWDISGQPAVPTELPGSFGIFNDDGGEPQVEVVVTGLHAGAVHVTRRALLTLVKEETLFLRMGLVSACMDMACGSDQSCVEGGCRPKLVDARLMPRYVADMEKSVECSSGTVFVNTSTKVPLPMIGSGCGAREQCTEGTCYELPGVPDMAVGGGDAGLSGASQVTTYAGTGQAGHLDGPGDQATFNMISGLGADSLGNLYLSEASGFAVRKIDANRIVSTFAGGQVSGDSDGIGTAARFGTTWGLVVDFSDHVYLADLLNNHVWEIDPQGNAAVLAGAGGPAPTAPGTGGRAGSAQINGPLALATDGSAVYVSTSDNLIMRIDLLAGDTALVAGGGPPGSDGMGAQAGFQAPKGLVASSGLLWVADTGGNRIRKIDLSTTLVSTVAGTGNAAFADGPGPIASFSSPLALAFDAQGLVWVADAGNATLRAIQVNGDVTTPTGTHQPGPPVDGPLLGAQFLAPGALVYSLGNLFVGDSAANVVRRIGLDLDLSMGWMPSMDAQSTPDPTVRVASATATSVTVSSVGGPGCGCNAQHLVIPTGMLSCGSSALEFDYSTKGNFGMLNSTALEIDLQDAFGKVGFFQGSEQTGHSNCAVAFGNNFPAAPQLKEGHNVVPLASIMQGVDGASCPEVFDRIDVHLQAYGCSANDVSSSTLSNLRVY